MDDPKMQLVWTALAAARDLLDSDPAAGWEAARRALGLLEEADEELSLVLEVEDAEALGEIVDGWVSGKKHLPAQDRLLLKRAMKAYRKRLKVTLLDAESSLGGGPMSSGRESDIVGIRPPERYPREIWDELVRQGRLVADRFGTYELPPGG